MNVGPGEKSTRYREEMNVKGIAPINQSQIQLGAARSTRSPYAAEERNSDWNWIREMRNETCAEPVTGSLEFTGEANERRFAADSADRSNNCNDPGVVY